MVTVDPSASDAPPPVGPRVFRFAPSPNGLLHLGHAYSALLNDQLARAAGGRLLLRLEDIDPQRCREDFARAIEQDLAWLGLDWERPVRRQSRHMRDHAAALDDLVGRGLAYPCFCTRGVVAAAVSERGGWPRDPDGAPLYPGLCRDLDGARRARRIAEGMPHTWRLDMTAARAAAPGPMDWREAGAQDGLERGVRAEPERWGDVVIGRKEVPTSYHLAVVLDDAAQGITDVVRGADLFAATGLHRLIQCLFGLPAPTYRHHRLILDADGRKLSKSRRAPSLAALRAAGRSAAAVRASLGFA